MLTYVIRRLIQLPFLLLLVSALVFFVLRLGPSPVDMATEAVRDPKEVERIRQAWGLDRPHLRPVRRLRVPGGPWRLRALVPQQRAGVAGHRRALPGDPRAGGRSEWLWARVIGISLGVLSAVRANTWVDTLARAFALTWISLPAFWVGLMLIGLLSVRLEWLPVGGRFNARTPIDTVTGFYLLDGLSRRDWEVVRTALRHMAMPAAVIGLAIAGLHRPDHPSDRARGSARGLHPNGPRQGAP